MKLDYRVKRDGRAWLAFLRRPGNSRPLFYGGRTKHEAIAALISGVANMAINAPARLFGPDWSEAANAQAAANRGVRQAGTGQAAN